MFEIIGLFVFGILIGRLLKNIKVLCRFSSYVNITVCLLIMVLGISVGANEYVVSEFKKISIISLILAFGGIIGSMFGAAFIGKVLSKL